MTLTLVSRGLAPGRRQARREGRGRSMQESSIVSPSSHAKPCIGGPIRCTAYGARGACVAVCRCGLIVLRHFADDQRCWPNLRRNHYPLISSALPRRYWASEVQISLEASPRARCISMRSSTWLKGRGLAQYIAVLPLPSDPPALNARAYCLVLCVAPDAARQRCFSQAQKKTPSDREI